MKAVGTTVNKNNIGSTLRRNGLKSCSSCKVPPLKKLQACLKFPVNIKMIQKSVGRKCHNQALWHQLCLEEEKC